MGTVHDTSYHSFLVGRSTDILKSLVSLSVGLEFPHEVRSEGVMTAGRTCALWLGLIPALALGTVFEPGQQLPPGVGVCSDSYLTASKVRLLPLGVAPYAGVASCWCLCRVVWRRRVNCAPVYL